MKLVLTLAGLAVIGVFAFQNCNKVPGAADAAGSSGQDSNVSRSSVPISDVTKISFYIPDIQTVNKSGNKFSVKFNKTLSLDMKTWEIVESNDYNNNTATYCMPSDMQTELTGIMSSSEICKSQPELSPDQVCTQVMKLPYAEMNMGDESLGLGSATDGCGSNSVDLCDEQAEILKAYIEKLNSSYTSFQCN